MSDLRIAILGPGAVGGLLAALATKHGAEVVCIATPSSSRRLSLKGLSITSNRFGTFRTNIKSESDLILPVDVLCVTVKAFVLDEALNRIPPSVLGKALVVPFLNGVEHVTLLRERLPLATVMPATIRIEVTQRAPGEIEQLSSLAKVEIANDPQTNDRVDPFVELLGKMGFDVFCRGDEEAMLWEKLGFLAPLALLTTAHDSPIGEVRVDHRDELVRVVNEISIVANAEGAPIDPADILLQLDSVPASMKSSMQRDARAGRPYEIEAVGGAILRRASAHLISVPATHRLVTRLRTS
jgi:2-dehydropantoate 2-reductase